MLVDRLAVVPTSPTAASLPKVHLHVHSEADLLAFTRNALRAAFVSSKRRAALEEVRACERGPA